LREQEGGVGRNIPAVRNRSLVINPAHVRQRIDNEDEIDSINFVLVENYRSQLPPMGVFVDNAPFVGLILLACISGVLGFMQLRKAKEEVE